MRSCCRPFEKLKPSNLDMTPASEVWSPSREWWCKPVLATSRVDGPAANSLNHFVLTRLSSRRARS
eukprot:scaffold2058_cov69-Phaeocystis_antarctica.AAC.10